MPNFESPGLFIDFSRLPPPKVIEEIDYEVLLRAYRDRAAANNPALTRAVELEQSPTNVILEPQAFRETLVRARVNSGARAIMLPFSTGDDLDNLVAYLNVQRLAVDPETGELESDDRLRRRWLLAVETFSSAGSEGAYLYHALTAAPTLRDATAVRVDYNGSVRVTLMNSGSDPTPTEAQILAVSSRLNHKNIKPLTDFVSVVPAEVIHTAINAEVTLYPGPDSNLVLADIQKAIGRVRDRISMLGRDLTRAALIGALNQEGVQNATLVTPAADIVTGPGQCVWIDSAAVTVKTSRTE